MPFWRNLFAVARDFTTQSWETSDVLWRPLESSWPFKLKHTLALIYYYFSRNFQELILYSPGATSLFIWLIIIQVQTANIYLVICVFHSMPLVISKFMIWKGLISIWKSFYLLLHLIVKSVTTNNTRNAQVMGYRSE